MNKSLSESQNEHLRKRFLLRILFFSLLCDEIDNFPDSNQQAIALFMEISPADI